MAFKYPNDGNYYMRSIERTFHAYICKRYARVTDSDILDSEILDSKFVIFSDAHPLDVFRYSDVENVDDNYGLDNGPDFNYYEELYLKNKTFSVLVSLEIDSFFGTNLYQNRYNMIL